MAAIILFLYRLFANILIWPLCLALRNHPNFKDTLRLRLSLKLPTPPRGDLIWFHGASLGEVKAIAGLIAVIKQRRPDLVICLTTMTATGRQAAAKIEGVDLILPFPFDLAWVMRRYLERLSPKVLVIAETEIWPNLILQAQAMGIEVLFVNARMSGETFKRYRIFSSFFAHILRKTRILAIAEEDAHRFSSLGALHVAVLGNLKFDALRSTDPGRADQIRNSLPGGDRPIFIAGSVREGEERMVIDAFRYATVRIPNLLALIAPRHPDRVQLLTDVAQEYGLKWGLRSKAGACDLLIVDTVGELFDLYGAADVAFVGGSLVDLGGQNVLEPIAWGVPTIHGPHMDNFTWALEAVEGNTLLVHDANELGRTIVDVLTQRDRYLPRARKAREALEKARGANELYAKAILETVS